MDKVRSAGRAQMPFLVRWLDANGEEQTTVARAVIDATGTWHHPNPLGVDGLRVRGEKASSERIDYGIPDILVSRRADFADRTVLVVGSGHSAINAALDLVRLKADAKRTRILWALRTNNIAKLFGGGADDQLVARGDLGTAAKHAVDTNAVELLAPFSAERVALLPNGIEITAYVGAELEELVVDRVIVATGFRPDFEMLRELRLSVDPIVEAPPALAPLIDPNQHSCGSVRPHGVVELSHPDAGFYIIGSKSYGRAPTFLMTTGYEQARSVVAEIAGDHEAARRVELVLPETGVCILSAPKGMDDCRLPVAASMCCSPSKVSTDVDRAIGATAVASSCCR